MSGACEIMARRCAECLLGKGRIVSGGRAAEIVRDTRERDMPFFCHKGTFASRRIVCAGHREVCGPALPERFARAVRIPIVLIDPDTLEPAA